MSGAEEGGEDRTASSDAPLLETVSRNVPIVLFSLDGDGVFTRSEGRGLDAIGLEPNEAVGTSVFDIYADYPRILDAVERALAGENVHEVVEVEDAAFEIYQDDGRWRWQLIDAAENVMASGAQDYDSRGAVEDAIEDIRSELDDASIIDIERAAFELTESDGQWRWRLIDETGNPVATSLTAYDSRREARDAMEVLQDHGPDALTQVAE